MPDALCHTVTSHRTRTQATLCRPQDAHDKNRHLSMAKDAVDAAVAAAAASTGGRKACWAADTAVRCGPPAEATLAR